MAGKNEIAFGLEVKGVEQSIKSVKDLKSAIKQLQDEAENADIGSDQYKNAIENIEKLNDKLKEVSQTEKQAAKATEDLAKAEQEAAKETGDLRKQFEVLEDELFMLAGQGKQNTAEFKKLTIEAANLNKKIDDVNQSLSGGGAERAEGGFSKLNDSLLKLDFKGVAQGAKMMGTALAATGVMLIVKMVSYLIENFDELSKGSGGLAKALRFVGDIIGEIIAVGEKMLNFVTDLIGLTTESERALEAQGNAIVESSKKTKAALAEQVKGFDNQIAAAKAAGKDTVQLEIAKQEAIIETNKKIAEQIIAFVASGGQLTEEQKKLFDESVANIKAAKQAESLVTITAEKAANDKAKELNKERTAANLAAIKVIEDAKIAAIKDEELRAFAKEVLDNERRLKEIDAGKESEELKRQEKEAQAILFENNLAKINADGAAKRKAIDDKAAADKATADAKIVADKKALQDIENAEKLAAAELAVLQKGNEEADLLAQLTVKRDIALQDATLTASQKLVIEQQYQNDVEAIKKTAAEKEKALELAKQNEILNFAQMSTQSHQALSDAFFAVKNRNLEKGSAAERKSAEQQFKVNKALAIQSAVITGIQGVMNALSAQSVLPEPIATVLRVATAVGVGISAAANIAKIASTKFDAGGGGGGGGAAALPSAPPIPSPPSISTQQNNTSQSTSFDETGKRIGSDNERQMTPVIQVKATVGVDEVSSKTNRVETLEKQSTF